MKTPGKRSEPAAAFALFARRLRDNRSGATLIEYTVLLSFILVATIGLVRLVGDKVDTSFQQLASWLGDAQAAQNKAKGPGHGKGFGQGNGNGQGNGAGNGKGQGDTKGGR